MNNLKVLLLLLVVFGSSCTYVPDTRSICERLVDQRADILFTAMYGESTRQRYLENVDSMIMRCHCDSALQKRSK